MLYGISFNDHFIIGSEFFSVGMIDSGSTFAYLPTNLYQLNYEHFEWYCNSELSKCASNLITVKNKNRICFNYSEEVFPEGPLEYFKSFPILNFKMKM